MWHEKTKISKFVTRLVNGSSKRFTVNKVVNFSKRKMGKCRLLLTFKRMEKVNVPCCLLSPCIGGVNSKRGA